MSLRILHALNYSIPLHSGYTFRALSSAIARMLLGSVERRALWMGLPAAERAFGMRECRWAASVRGCADVCRGIVLGGSS